MLRSFADKHTEEVFVSGMSRRFPPETLKRATRKLEYVHLATSLDDLRSPPSNRLHALEGNRKGQYSISVNDQWRICFRSEDGDSWDVQLTDYH